MSDDISESMSSQEFHRSLLGERAQRILEQHARTLRAIDPILKGIPTGVELELARIAQISTGLGKDLKLISELSSLSSLGPLIELDALKGLRWSGDTEYIQRALEAVSLPNPFMDAAALALGADFSVVSPETLAHLSPSPVELELAQAARMASPSRNIQLAFLDAGLASVIEESWVGEVEEPKQADGTDDDSKLQKEHTLLVVGTWLTQRLLDSFVEDPALMSSLDAGTFEELIGYLLSQAGFDVAPSGHTNSPDGGIDLLAIRRNATFDATPIGVQIKHSSVRNSVGIGDVQRLLAWKPKGLGFGLLVTNSTFSSEARDEAQQAGVKDFIRLRDRETLRRWCAGEFASVEERKELLDEVRLTRTKSVQMPSGNSFQLYMPPTAQDSEPV